MWEGQERERLKREWQAIKIDHTAGAVQVNATGRRSDV
jgi:hypothetical protein